MMNRDLYHHASSSSSSVIMPFGLDQYNWDHTQETQPNYDPPLALPLGPTTSNFPFYSPHHLAAAADYPSSTFMMIKSEDGGGGGSSSRPIGLNLGHRTYFSSGDAMSIDRLLSARASQHHHHHHHHQPPRCQAEGCKADLSGAKHYHRRHKVCEFHSKATVVVAGGIQQRFCQQCSRFHVLSEFDESKRSCRKRLAEHNRRRRKPQNNNNAGNNSSSSADKLKPNAAPPRPSRDSISSKCTAATSTAAAAAASNGGLDQGNQGEQSKAVLIRNGPAPSLGGRTQHQHQHQGLYSNSYNTGTAATASFYNHHHQSLQFGSSSSNDASLQSTGNGGAGSGPDQHHLGQARFPVDFM